MAERVRKPFVLLTGDAAQEARALVAAAALVGDVYAPFTPCVGCNQRVVCASGWAPLGCDVIAVRVMLCGACGAVGYDGMYSPNPWGAG